MLLYLLTLTRSKIRLILMPKKFYGFINRLFLIFHLSELTENFKSVWLGTECLALVTEFYSFFLNSNMFTYCTVMFVKTLLSVTRYSPLRISLLSTSLPEWHGKSFKKQFMPTLPGAALGVHPRNNIIVRVLVRI